MTADAIKGQNICENCGADKNKETCRMPSPLGGCGVLSMKAEPMPLIQKPAETSADIAPMLAEVAALREALENYMSAFGQALDAHGITYSDQQRGADTRARALLNPTAGEGNG